MLQPNKLTKTDLLTLQKVFQTLISDLDFKAITQNIVNLMTKYLGALGGILFLVNQEKKYFYSYTVSETAIIKFILKTKLKKTLRSYRLPLSYPQEHLIKNAILNKKIYTGADITDFICPPVPLKTAKIIQKIARIHFTVSLPVVFRHKTIGALWLNFKEKQLPPNKMRLLKLFAEYTALALNNTINFNLLKKQKTLLEKQNIRLKKLLKMRSEFLTIASHQLRTPISVIRGNIALLLEDLDKNAPPEIKEAYQGIGVKTEKLTQIISDILYAMELDTGDFTLKGRELECFNITLFLKEILKKHQKQAQEKKIALRLLDASAINPKQPLIAYGSQRYLQVVLDSMLLNALTYTAEGGLVMVKIKPKKDIIRIEIKDNGIGIPKIDQEELYTKFKRAGNANSMHTDGSGLGLFIVKKMIQAHPRGNCGFKSQENKGSVFWVEVAKKQTGQV
ncbi:MAG: GAF domain-containing sensor histidine kinase [Candidatus Jacksonbacteria bacterium]